MPHRNHARTAIVHAAQQHRTAEALKQANRRLSQENARLAAAHEAVRRVVGRLSHDMRSQLSVIQDYSSLVREGLAGETTSQQREYLGIVGDRVDELTGMIDDVHDMSGLVAGALRLWRRECRIEDLLEHRLAHWQRRATGRKVAFEATIPDDLSEVYCDVEKISRVVNCLVVQAIKRAPAGGEVALSARADGDDRVIVGVGVVGQTLDDREIATIAAELARAEFDAPAAERLGASLAVANAIVRLGLGSMSVERESPNLCTYSFTLPVYEPFSIVEQYARLTRTTAASESHVALLTARVGDDVESNVTPVVDEYLQSTVNPDDLVVQVAALQWLLAIRGRANELPGVVRGLTAGWSDTLCELPLDPAPRLEVAVIGAWHGAAAHHDLLGEARQLLSSLAADQPIDDAWRWSKRRMVAAAGAL